MVVKEAYTSNTLAPMMGMTRQGIDWKAKNENWQSRPRSGRGGGKEWLVSSMPENTRLAIQVAEEKAALAESEPSPALPALSAITQAAIMDDSRRNKALARADLVRQYLSWLRRYGHGKKQRQDFIAAYMGGAWPKLLEEVGKVSWQTLERWKVAQERAGSVLALTDKRGVAHRGRTLLTERHRTVILGHILNPNAPAISQCVNEVQRSFRRRASISRPSRQSGAS